MNIIFDLDGTLIDSASSILRSLELAFKARQVEMKCSLDNSLIGPPLNLLLKQLSGSDDEKFLGELADAFKERYDSEGYQYTEVYENIEVLLKELSSKHRLYIATNKRLKPTQKILDFLNWNSYFHEVYTLDSCSQADNKTEMIAHIVETQNLDKRQTIYVGDTVADRVATERNELIFVMVSWGYDFEVRDDDLWVNRPVDLLAVLANAAT